MTTTLPYGSWPSEVEPEVVARGANSLSELQRDADTLCWLESRPAEGGRNVVMRRMPDGKISASSPAGTNARTRVHEYGGGSYLVADGILWFTDLHDQRIYRCAEGEPPGRSPRSLWSPADGGMPTFS